MDVRPIIRNFELAFFRSKLSRVFAELMYRKAVHLYDKVIDDVGPLPAGGKIADVGCGHATFLALYLSKYPETKGTGVDQSAELINFARKICAEHGANADFLVGDAHEVKLPEKEYDVIVSLSSIYLWYDPVKAINNLKKALKPGGKLIIYEELPARSVKEFAVALFEQKLYGLGLPAYTEQEMREFITLSDFKTANIDIDRLIIRMEMSQNGHSGKKAKRR
jgi:ubiquinone/menaquinone biosynthesis C-methylase UbiE